MESGTIYVVFMVMVGREPRGFILGVGTPWMGIELNSFRALQRRTVSVRFLISAWSTVRSFLFTRLRDRAIRIDKREISLCCDRVNLRSLRCDKSGEIELDEEAKVAGASGKLLFFHSS